jgi:hypothetical protein
MPNRRDFSYSYFSPRDVNSESPILLQIGKAAAPNLLPPLPFPVRYPTWSFGVATWP